MNRMSTKQLAAVAIAALAVAGGTAAVAAASSSSSKSPTVLTTRGPGDELAAAASYLGIGVGDLQTQLQAGKTLAQIANATSGKSADGLIAALVAAEQAEHPDASASLITQRVTNFVNGVLPPGGPGFGHGPGGVDLSTAASYVGLSVSDLVSQLQSGKTLAQIAVAQGKTADGLIQALVAADTTRITALVNGTA